MSSLSKKDFFLRVKAKTHSGFFKRSGKVQNGFYCSLKLSLTHVHVCGTKLIETVQKKSSIRNIFYLTNEIS